MSPAERDRLRREAQHRLRALRLRARALRARVYVLAAIGFAVIWGVVFTQMISGHDPALSAKQTGSVATTAGREQGSGSETALTSRSLGDEEDEAAAGSEAEAALALERFEAEEAEAAEIEAAELEAAEAEAIELEAATTGQS